MIVTGGNRLRRASAGLVACLLLSLAPVAAAADGTSRGGDDDRAHATIAALAERQREELDIPPSFFPFLESQAEVETGREIYAQAAPDMAGSDSPELLEVDLRYSYSVREQQGPLPTVSSDVDTKINVRSADTGRKQWSKRYERDAWPFPMRVGDDGRPGVVVISGLWNFYGTTEESTLTFDAFDGRSGKRLWTRSYTSMTSYELLTTVAHDAPVTIDTFDGREGPAEDLLIGLATIVGSPFAETMATRVVVVDGGDGSEHAHPAVDVGVNWWPIPQATGDLDGDGLDDYATTNNIGVDPGGGQQPPSFGGTVYARRGADGASIWTTSGIDMEFYAFPQKLPDVVAGRTSDVALSTYVRGERILPLPISVPFIDPFGYEPRVYLFEGRFGAVAWHKQPWDWVHSPGDIDSNGQHDLVLGRYRVSMKRSRSVFEQLAVDGEGDRLWSRRSIWRFETMPCPEGACFGGWGLSVDVSPDVQPDRVRDLLLGQFVQQNAAFEDSITRIYDGRTGRVRFEDELFLQSASGAVDGRGTDLVAFDHRDGDVEMIVRDGIHNRTLWSGTLGGPDDLRPRNSGFWAQGLRLPGDRCADLLVNGYERMHSFYGVFDGGGGRLLWSRWTGPASDRPRFTDRHDANDVC